MKLSGLASNLAPYLPQPRWVDWTPTVTQSGSVAVTVTEAKYAIIGKVCFVQAQLVVTGSGTTANGIVIAGQPAAIQAALTTSWQPLGTCTIEQAGVGVYFGSLVATAATTWYLVSDKDNAYMGATPAFGLAADDKIMFQATYRIA